MNKQEDEFAEESASFFAEFVESTRDGKSKRKLNREANDEEYRLKVMNENRTPAEVAKRIADAKKKIALSVFGNASKKEKGATGSNKRSERPAAKKKPTFGAKVMAKEQQRQEARKAREEAFQQKFPQSKKLKRLN